MSEERTSDQRGSPRGPISVALVVVAILLLREGLRVIGASRGHENHRIGGKVPPMEFASFGGWSRTGHTIPPVTGKS
jgi:hypothetical protein